MTLGNSIWRRAAAALVVLLVAGPVSAQTCHNTPGNSPDDVIGACTHLITSGHPNNQTLARYFNNRGVAFANKHDYDRALADYDRSLKLNPRDPVVYVNRAWASRQKDDLKRALEDYGRAIELDPKYIDAYLERARTLSALHEHDKAIADADAAVRLNPRLAAGYLLRGTVYGQKADYGHALPDLDRAVALEPEAGSFFWRGYVYLQKNDLDHAAADFNRAIELNPKVSAYHVQRGEVYERRGFIENALADFEEAIRLAPNDAVAFKERGVARRRKGDLHGAVADYSQAIRLDPRYNAAYVERGRAYESLSNLSAARADYQTAASLPPKYDNGPSAVGAARARLAALSGSVGVPAPRPSPPVPAPPPGRVSPPPPPQGQTPAPPPVATNVPAGRKLALVIGNSAYQRQALRNPDNDARAMAKALRGIGFQVIDGYNLDYAGMRRAISDFAVNASKSDLALVFYAGHGLGIAGHNYLVPTDAKMESAVAASFELFDLDQIIASLDDPARTTIVFLDACRNNPFATQASTRAMNRGGGLVGYDSVSAGMLIAFATRPGQVAKDGAGDHSPFTAALLKYIATPHLEILDMMRRVRRDVLQETNGEQITWDNESLFGNVYLVDDGTRATAR